MCVSITNNDHAASRGQQSGGYTFLPVVCYLAHVAENERTLFLVNADDAELCRSVLLKASNLSPNFLTFLTELNQCPSL